LKKYINDLSNSDFEFLASSNKKLCNYFVDLKKIAEKKKKSSKNLEEKGIEKQIETFFIDNLIISHVFGMFNPFYQDKLRGIKTSQENSELLVNSQLSGLFSWMLGLKARDLLMNKKETINQEFDLHLVTVVNLLMNSYKKTKIKESRGNKINEENIKAVIEVIIEMNRRYLKNFENEQLISLIELRKLINFDNPISNFFNKCIKRITVWDRLIDETIMNILDLTDIDDIKFVFGEMNRQKNNLQNDNRIVKLISYYRSFLYTF